MTKNQPDSRHKGDLPSHRPYVNSCKVGHWKTPSDACHNGVQCCLWHYSVWAVQYNSQQSRVAFVHPGAVVAVTGEVSFLFEFVYF